MRSTTFALALAIIAAVTPGYAGAEETKAVSTSKSWSFDAETPDKPPTGFSFGAHGERGSGSLGRTCGERRPVRGTGPRADRYRCDRLSVPCGRGGCFVRKSSPFPVL